VRLHVTRALQDQGRKIDTSDNRLVCYVSGVQTVTGVMADSLKPAPEVLARRLPGGAVLVHMRTNRIFELNETGARIWELL